MNERFFCAQCQRDLDERQLSMKSVTVESCPFCGTKVRESGGMRATNLDAIIMEDVAAIDTWLDNHEKTTGLRTRKHHAERHEYEWAVETTVPWTCEVSYSQSSCTILEFRLVSTEISEAVLEERLKLQTICASYGCQPHGNRHTDEMTGTVRCTWGAVQYLSTSTLCEDLFEPVTVRLSDAMNAVKQAISGQA
jgi:hypothetical protein